jgi:hypothetical protein
LCCAVPCSAPLKHPAAKKEGRGGYHSQRYARGTLTLSVTKNERKEKKSQNKRESERGYRCQR